MNKRKIKVNLNKLLIILIAIVAIVAFCHFSGDNIFDIESSNLTSVTIDINNIPEYSGSPYIYINNNEPYFTENDFALEEIEYYSKLDSLGRCGVTYANICKKVMPDEDDERDSISNVIPSGWKQVSYKGLIDGNYLYNRCHLIGYQLAGENANERNLITGTRYLNIEGMLPFENMVAEYIDDNPNNHVLYRVTPIFQGNNLVASGVQIEAYSIEDKGEKIKFNIYAYNVQPGVVINYATGESHLAE